MKKLGVRRPPEFSRGRREPEREFGQGTSSIS
jgi:hypothetical protein